MSHRNNKLYMSRTFTAHLFLGHLYTAPVTDDAFIANTLVFAAGTLIVLCRTEDAFTEKAVTLGLIGTVVDGLRLDNLTKRTLKYLFRGRQTDGDLGNLS